MNIRTLLGYLSIDALRVVCLSGLHGGQFCYAPLRDEPKDK